jgi:hypothetical protein
MYRERLTSPCPTCGANSLVVGTDRTTDGDVIRQRQCRMNPKHMFETVESLRVVPTDAQNRRAMMEAVRRKHEERQRQTTARASS